MMGEVRKFKMHPRMLLDIITRQCGTLEKAVLEAAMNGIEAGATRFDIDFSVTPGNPDKYRLVMTDNGKGIESRKELEDHFEQFGTPHDESEGKIWAQFRMGRGQCFAQGKNVWHTCGWRMETDIRADVEQDRQPQYHLTKSEYFKGCRIEIDVYPGKYSGNVEKLKDLVVEQLAFVSTDVYFNGERINHNPVDLNWTEEDDDAYYMFGRGQDLVIYNLGVKCQKIPASRAGTVGIIVSKKQLKVNFARNEVLSDCPVMNRINQVIKRNRIKQTRKQQRRLDPHERVAVLADIRNGDADIQDYKNIGLFYTTSGRSVTFRDILNNRVVWSFASDGNSRADKLMQAGQALVLDEGILADLNYRGDRARFFRWIAPLERWKEVEKLYRPFEELTAHLSDSAIFVPNKQWTKVEKRLVRVLESFQLWNGRAIVIGLSDCYLAWTDGRSFIALGRDYIRRLSLSNTHGAAQLFATMFHEMAHDTRTDRSHIHGEEFYRNFHNIVCSSNYSISPFGYIAQFVDKMRRAVNEEATEAAQRREQKAKERVEKELGIGEAVAAKSDTSAPDKTPKTRTRAKTPKNRPGVRRKRRPRGAEF